MAFTYKPFPSTFWPTKEATIALEGALLPLTGDRRLTLSARGVTAIKVELQVAKYETPAPLDIFLRKKALQVVTHQMVDLILPDYNVIRRSAAPGGGEAARLLGANLNPFRRRSEPPVAFWTGVIDAGPEPREARFEIPDYFNGELRVMAVGVSAGKLGAPKTTVTVRSPIVLTPALPVAVAPNDAFDVSVGVANTLDDSGPQAEVVLSAAPSDRIALEGDASQALLVAEGVRPVRLSGSALVRRRVRQRGR